MPTREALPSCAVVMLTRTVCSLLRASCLFSRFRRCFCALISAQNVFKLPSQVSSNDDGDAEDNAYLKMDLYSTFEFRNCPDLFSKHMALKTCSG